jgi:alkylated DNA repair dioxygenase AlkB
MEQIAARLPEPVNHCIIIRYHDGLKTYAPWHSDKCEELGRRTGCMKRGSSFFVISVGDPRTFELGDESAVLWSNALPHRSMITVDAATNAMVKHQVPPDKHWVGCRWSLIFRTIVE